jgi:hypothetical protein
MEVASRVAEAFHSTADPTRPPAVCVPPACTPTPPASSATLLSCGPATVRRWIHRDNADGASGLADRPRVGRPRLGSPCLGQRIRRLLARPPGWTIGRLWSQLGRPQLSQRTLRRQVRQVASWRRPRLIAMGDPDRQPILADLHDRIRSLPEGAVVQTHLNLLPWVHSIWIANGCRQQAMLPGTNGGGRSSARSTCELGRFLYQVVHKAVSASFTAFRTRRWPPTGRAIGGGYLRQRDHPPLQDRPAVAGRHPLVVVLHGARYSRHDNPVERIWGALEAWLANSPTLTSRAACARSTPSSAPVAPPSS